MDTVTISQQEDKNLNRQFVDIYFGKLSEKGNREGGTYSLREFNNNNYLKKFIEKFKGQETSCWLLFYTYIGHSPEKSSVMKENIKRVLSFSSDTLILSPSLIPRQKPKNWLKKIFPGDNRPPFPTYLINFNENCFSHFQEIIDCIDSGDSGMQCYFLFSSSSDKDALFLKCENLYKERRLDKQNISFLSPEFIELGLGCCGHEDIVHIFTNRFDLKIVEGIFLNSIDKEKFTVIVKR